MSTNPYGLDKPFFVLAPMDDVTDTVFRQIIRQTSTPDLYFTEFVNVDGLQSKGKRKVAQRLKLALSETNVIAQIWGLKPDNFYSIAKEIAQGVYGPYIGIDLNMGCPEKAVVKSGACAGLIQNQLLAKEIITATKAGAGTVLPVSVKTRLGFNEVNFAWLEFLLQQDLGMLTIHGRTRKEMSKVPAHWDDIGRVSGLRDKLAQHTLIVGNGDVENRGHGLELAAKYNLDGIMIGRGIFQDPFAFAARSLWTTYTREQKLTMYARHVHLFTQTWQPSDQSIHTLNKFCKIYVNGFDGAKELRERFMNAKSAPELLHFVEDAL